MDIVLATERLTLRKIVPSDEEIYVRHYSEPEAQDHILRGQRDPDQVRGFVQRACEEIGMQEACGDYFLTAILTTTGEIIGGCSLLYAYEDSTECAIGWHISASFSRAGLGTELAKGLVRFAFLEARSACVWADCFSHNRAGIRVLQNAGLRLVQNGPWIDRMRSAQYGENRPVSRFQITRTQWMQRHE